jgi:hypothetical protein
MENKLISKATRSVPVRTTVAAAILVSLSFLFLASPASAACISAGSVYCDTTQVAAFNGTTFQSTYSGNNFVSGIGDTLQSPGNNFNTDRLVATLTEHRGTVTLDLQYYTSFDGNDQGARYADIFLGNNPTSPNTFGYAISLGDEAVNGGTSKGFYKVSSTSEKTSEQIWASKAATYGGEFKGTDGVWRTSPTVVTTAAIQNSTTQEFTTTVSETTSSADPGYGYLVDAKISASATDFNALFGNGLSVFWGTADCSNDAIEALVSYTPVHVPEPMTMSLFTAGLTGAAAIRRRRKKQAKFSI